MGALLGRLERRRARGQALVEFSLTIVIFLVLLMAIVDLGRGIYQFNGVSEAAREIARVTSVHPGTGFGNSPETINVVKSQKAMIPNLNDPTFACVDMTDTVVPARPGQVPSHEGQPGQGHGRGAVQGRDPAPRASWHLEHAVHQQFGDPMNRLSRTGRRERRDGGQIIVIFALAAVAIIGMVGLVLDGGSTYAQRRSQQNAADLAAIAAANQYLLTDDKARATTTARTIATQNGFDPTAGSNVIVSWGANDTHVKVNISADHQNSFASIMGFNKWPVSTEATVEVGIPDTTTGGAPFIFNKDVFTDPGGVPKTIYSDPGHPFTFGDGNGDVPNDPDDIAWTCYGTCGNVDSSTVRSMVDGTSPVSVTLDPTVDFTTYIGQQNNGNHSTLFGEVDSLLVGQELAVPIVDDNGLFQGWATFHVTGADQGGKTLTGYFVSPFDKNTQPARSPAARGPAPSRATSGPTS